LPDLDSKRKPVDRWLGLGSIAVGVVFFLLPKTPLVIVLSLVLIFALLIHPVWNFWWIEGKLWRRLGVCCLFVACLFLLGRASWPPSNVSDMTNKDKPVVIKSAQQPAKMQQEPTPQAKSEPQRQPEKTKPESRQQKKPPSPQPTTLPIAQDEKAVLRFSFWPMKSQDIFTNEISAPLENGVVTVAFTARNISTVQANNGAIWIRISDVCRFAEEPEGSVKTVWDVVRQKRFDSFYAGVVLNPTYLKIIPPPQINSFTIACMYACEKCPPLDNEHPQILKVNLVKP
jgi:hypothetical protein